MTASAVELAEDQVPDDSLSAAAVWVLETADPDVKARRSRRAYEAWWTGAIDGVGEQAPPDRPARPETPELRLPREMPKRGKAGSLNSRIALLHALAHIELNAVDLAWDIVARFAPTARRPVALPRAFFTDWARVGADEGRHFQLLSERLRSLGSRYGALPAHDGLWSAALDTAKDLSARLAVVPMVLEARGLDVTPGMITNLATAGDQTSADILQIIHDDEIGHVAAGKKWFDYVCSALGQPSLPTWQKLVRLHFRGQLKAPFNVNSRQLAGFPSEYYEPLSTHS